ncbi:hypothetical protein KC19_2G147700 [Ceratodon purpureus]|uniref:Uncharacterized protein n=1 Tax=Ceratodon purpureus TaxID=3225 RepID=A0A8T0IWZ4_CERPU|nr:hypothetical protein KC19_2G147700 [Ceratodon purpureus]
MESSSTLENKTSTESNETESIQSDSAGAPSSIRAFNGDLRKIISRRCRRRPSLKDTSLLIAFCSSTQPCSPSHHHPSCPDRTDAT